VPALFQKGYSGYFIRSSSLGREDLNVQRAFPQGAKVASAGGTRTRVNGHKLKHRKFHLKMRKNFFTVRVTEH